MEGEKVRRKTMDNKKCGSPGKNCDWEKRQGKGGAFTHPGGPTWPPVPIRAPQRAGHSVYASGIASTQAGEWLVSARPRSGVWCCGPLHLHGVVIFLDDDSLFFLFFSGLWWRCRGWCAAHQAAVISHPVVHIFGGTEVHLLLMLFFSLEIEQINRICE